MTKEAMEQVKKELRNAIKKAGRVKPYRDTPDVFKCFYDEDVLLKEILSIPEIQEGLELYLRQFKKKAKKLIALIPDEFQVEEEFAKAFAKDYRKDHEALHKVDIEEAKKQERERMVKELNPYVEQVVKEGWQCKDGYALVDPMVLVVLSHWWQALKGLEEG